MVLKWITHIANRKFQYGISRTGNSSTALAEDRSKLSDVIIFSLCISAFSILTFRFLECLCFFNYYYYYYYYFIIFTITIIIIIANTNITINYRFKFSAF